MDIKNNRAKYFSLSLFYLILSRVIAQLFRLVARIVIARYSNADLYGEFSVIWNEMLFVGLVVLIGLGQQLTIDLPRKEKNEQNHTILSAFIYSIILCIIAGIIAIIFNAINLDSTYKFSMIISTFYVLFLISQFILIGLKDFFGIFLLNLIQNSSLLLLIVLLRNNLTIENLAYSTAGSILLASISLVVYIFLRHKYSIKDIEKEKLKVFDFPARRLFLFIVDIVDSLIIYLLVKLPDILLGSTYAGYVSIAFSIMSFVVIIPQIITVAMGPLISEEYNNNSYMKMHSTFRTSMSLCYVLQGLAVIFFSYFGNHFIALLYGSEYTNGTFYIFYGFLFAVIIDSYTYPFGLYLRNTNYEKIFGIGKIISLISFVIFEPLLLFLMKDTMAIPIAYFIAKIVLLGFYLLFIIKNNEMIDSTDIRKLLTWFLIVLTSFISIIIINNYVNNILYLILISIAHMLLLILSIQLLKIVNLKSLIIDIKTKFLKKKSITE